MSALKILDEQDLDWVTEVIDVVEAAAGKPWRVALERLEGAQRLDQPTAPQRFAAVIGAIQRILGGRARNAKLARALRSRVLGHPVLSSAERDERIANAASALEISTAAVESLLWSDLPRERPVELPAGRPSELEVAALANVQLIQRQLGRAQSVTIRIWGDAGGLIRAAALRGLLTTTSVGSSGETVLDIVGPIALFHRTSVYGRALGGLVPLLAECEHFELEIRVDAGHHTYTTRLASPALLPAVPARLVAPTSIVTRLIRDLSRLAPELVLTRPPPIVAGQVLVCPDLAIEVGAGRWYVELVGFWTADYLDRKIASYRTAGMTDVILCIDESRSCADDEPRTEVVRFTKRIPADEIVGRIKVG